MHAILTKENSPSQYFYRYQDSEVNSAAFSKQYGSGVEMRSLGGKIKGDGRSVMTVYKRQG